MILKRRQIRVDWCNKFLWLPGIEAYRFHLNTIVANIIRVKRITMKGKSQENHTGCKQDLPK